jgi:hypothetical protein
LTVWENAPLPQLPDLYSGIYIREGGPHAIYEQLADEIAAAILPPADDSPNLLGAAAKARKANTAA